MVTQGQVDMDETRMEVGRPRVSPEQVRPVESVRNRIVGERDVWVEVGARKHTLRVFVVDDDVLVGWSKSRLRSCMQRVSRSRDE